MANPFKPGKSPTPARPAGPADKRFTGQHDIVSWAYDLLAAMRIPANSVNVAFLVAWANIESSGYNPRMPGGRNNPLNTTEKSQGGVAGQGGSQGDITDFLTYEDGIRNQAHNLLTPAFGYPAIVAALKGTDPTAMAQAVNGSSFGTHFPIPFNPGKVGPGSVTNPNIGSGGGGGGSGGGTQAQTTNVITDIVGALSGLPGLSGVLGPLAGVKGVTAPFALFFGIFQNWRYIVEVMLGGTVVLLGGLLIAHDTGADKKVAQAAGTAAVVAA